METFDVTFFKPYPFFKGQKIHIEAGSRKGDWEVIEITKNKVTLKCPISGRVFEWNRFCYFAKDEPDVVWPQKD